MPLTEQYSRAMKQTYTSYRRPVRAAVALSVCGLAVACSSSPFQERTLSELRASVLESAQRELRPLGEAGVDRTPSGREGTRDFLSERLEELNKMAGPGSYNETDAVLSSDIAEDLDEAQLDALREAEAGLFELGEDLLGEGAAYFRLTLRQAVSSAVSSNLDVQIAHLEPAISEAQVAVAESVFDWVFFATYEFARLDRVQQTPVVAGVPVGVGSSESIANSYTTGIRKQLTSGGQFEASQGQTNANNLTTGFALSPDPSNAAFIELGLTQPFLRGAGPDVATSQIRLARNLERSTIHTLKLLLIQTVRDTESAYWRLVQVQGELDIQRRSLLRGILTRDILEKRLNFDARPAEYSDAVATVERRRNSLILSQQAVRDASDNLKALMNDPSLPVSGEIVLSPIDSVVTEPVTFSLLDSLMTALDLRPDIAIAVLAMDNASINQAVSENNLLPTLDLDFRTRFTGLDSDINEAYRQIGDGQFVDYTLGLNFEQPLGNRQARSLYRQRELERLQTVIDYRRAVQSVALSLKLSLRNVETSFRLIEQSRVSRLAATDNLRSLRVLEQTIQQLDPNFLDLKFGRQDALASAELEEIRAMVAYNIAIADYFAAEGTILERSGIRFDVPDASEIDE